MPIRNFQSFLLSFIHVTGKIINSNHEKYIKKWWKLNTISIFWHVSKSHRTLLWLEFLMNLVLLLWWYFCLSLLDNNINNLLVFICFFLSLSLPHLFIHSFIHVLLFCKQGHAATTIMTLLKKRLFFDTQIWTKSKWCQDDNN